MAGPTGTRGLLDEIALWLFAPMVVAGTVAVVATSSSGESPGVHGPLRDVTPPGARFVESDVVDLGKVLSGYEYGVEVTLRNPLDGRLRLVGVETACGCLGFRLPSSGLELEPGESTTLAGIIRVSRDLGYREWTVGILVEEPVAGRLDVEIRATVLGGIKRATLGGQPADGWQDLYVTEDLEVGAELVIEEDARLGTDRRYHATVCAGAGNPVALPGESRSYGDDCVRRTWTFEAPEMDTELPLQIVVTNGVGGHRTWRLQPATAAVPEEAPLD